MLILVNREGHTKEKQIHQVTIKNLIHCNLYPLGITQHTPLYVWRGLGGKWSWLKQDGRNQKGIFSTISLSISNKHYSLLQTFKLRTLALKGPQAKLQVGVKL